VVQLSRLSLLLGYSLSQTSYQRKVGNVERLVDHLDLGERLLGWLVRLFCLRLSRVDRLRLLGAFRFFVPGFSALKATLALSFATLSLAFSALSRRGIGDVGRPAAWF